MRATLLLLLGSFGFFAMGCDPTPPDPCAGGSAAGDPSCPPKQFCGGIAAFPCPGAGTCVDDPNDSCDPTKGGADCGGLCECNALGFCVEGYEWDSSPAVCGCVEKVDPCAAVRCASGYHCESAQGTASCVPDTNPCAAVLCMVGTECVVTNGEAACVPMQPVACGKVICPAGQVCCNSSCSMCVPPGMSCIQIACE